MKTQLTVLTIAGSAMLLAKTCVAQSQVYSFSGQVNGFVQTDMNFGIGSGGGSSLGFGLLSETLYYDPVAQTLRQKGVVSLNATSVGFNINDMVGIYQASGSANLLINNGNNELAFDTGVVPASNSAFPLAFDFFRLWVPISGSVEIIRNSQAYTTTVAYSLFLDIRTTVFSANADSLLFAQKDEVGPLHTGSLVGAAGGLGIYSGGSDNVYYVGWTLNPSTAIVVPEPSVFSLVGIVFAISIWLTPNRLKISANPH